MLLGYARVSTDGQHHALQSDALQAAGCERIVTETASGARADRPELIRLMETARKGDVLVVWRLDRLGRSLKHLIELSEQLQARGIGLRSLTEGIDTSTPGGRFVFSILGALAAMEREVLIERTKAGLAAAAARGRKGGAAAVTGCRQDPRSQGHAGFWRFDGARVGEASRRQSVDVVPPSARRPGQLGAGSVKVQSTAPPSYV
jgi:DNA invertase Pin-like site-specific DNA recombinase